MDCAIRGLGFVFGEVIKTTVGIIGKGERHITFEVDTNKSYL